MELHIQTMPEHGPTGDLGPAPSIAERFDAMVAGHPDALAVASGSLRLTYRALGVHIDALAAELAAVRAGDHGPIAVIAPHGALLAIALFAVLKCRRVCVPLDPGMPAPRRDRIVADADATLVVTAAAASDAGTTPFKLRRAFAIAPRGVPSAPVTHPAIAAPDAPALILYTSGSTGAPKGVVYAHGAVLERIVQRDRFAVNPGDRLGVFGAAGMNLFRALCNGAALVSWDVARGGLAGIAAWVANEEISLLHCLPTLFRQWVAALSDGQAWPRLRWVSLTGEPVVRLDVAAFRRVFPAHCALVNGLGTTEAGTFCQWTDRYGARLAPLPVDSEIVPVGSPVERMSVRLVDADGARVAPGAIGEIVVGGDLLAAGYWQDPELDAARFRPDPAQPGGRCYATGDLGRQTTDGALLHLGRRDLQLKVRGVRIEAAEVEGVLRGHPDVRDVAVAGQRASATPGETRLVACVAAREWRPDLAADLARFVRARLPDPMVPDGWSFVAGLPVTPAGKVDRRALPEPPPRRERRFEPGVCQRFVRVAATYPQAIAFRCVGATLTYADLDRQSAQLARRLMAAGIGDGDVVALALPRTPFYAVALIAVLRAGGACMPLDPNGPRERNAAMLGASRARALLASTLPAFDVDDDIVRIDPAVGDDPAADADAMFARQYDPDRFAFLLYTSGSMGIPKGVEVREGQVLHRLRWDWDARPFVPGEVACARGTVGFVDTISEWLGPLLAGVTTEIIPDPLLLQPRDMIAALAAARVTRILLVPSQLELLLDTAPELGRELPALRLWTASGEPLSLATVDRFRRAMPEGTLWNVYGATEAWDATCQRVDSVDAVTPIGTPLPGMRAYVLDDALAPAPVGVAGELYLAGDGLALGYRDDDALTRERFVDNPFCPGSGDRLYRTGDRARRRDDGLLECLGRADRRVKINGVRVELSEVEAVLALHRDVREAAVEAADGRIVGYVVARDARGIDRAHLREFLRGRLLAAAMPSEVLELPMLPRNARGKVERSALTLPMRPSEVPRTELERTLVQIFADVLGRQGIGATDDFFDCGGDSLLGVRLVGEIEELTGRPFRLDALAVAATPRAIAAALDQSWSAWATEGCITINASGHAAPLFGICGAWGYAVRLLRLGRALGADVPFHALQPPQMRWPPGSDLRAMAARYAAQIRTLAPHGPCRLIGTSFGGIMAFEVALQLQAQGYPVPLLCAVDSAPPGSTLKPPRSLRPGAGAIEQAGLQVYLAHMAAANGYAPDGQFAGRMLYFRCPGARRSVVREWAPWVRDPLEIVPVPGIHGDFHIEPQLSAIAHPLRAALAGSAPRAAAPITARWSHTHASPALGAGRAAAPPTRRAKPRG